MHNLVNRLQEVFRDSNYTACIVPHPLGDFIGIFRLGTPYAAVLGFDTFLRDVNYNGELCVAVEKEGYRLIIHKIEDRYVFHDTQGDIPMNINKFENIRSFLDNPGVFAADPKYYANILSKCFGKGNQSLHMRQLRKWIKTLSSDKFFADLLYFSFGSEDVESTFFKYLLNSYLPIPEVCRYTTLESILCSLKYGSFRMNSVTGMNDPHEQSFMEKVLRDDLKNHSFMPARKHSQYIMSCSDMSNFDDLTMWRLYADDAKGVCLRYKVKLPEHTSFILSRVNYSSASDASSELKFLERLMQNMEHPFVFKNLYNWRLYFKSKAYDVEKEIRLLYNETAHLSGGVKKDWIKTYGNSIVIPALDFPMDQFPLELVEIRLGPKCPEKEINKAQLEALIAEKYPGKNIKVTISEIDNYR